MKECYTLKDGSIIQAPDDRAEVLIYVTPADEEKKQIVEALRLDRHDLESALDPDEVARLQFYPDGVYMIWKRPKNVSVDPHLRLDVSSAGLFLHPDKLQMIMSEYAPPFSSKEFQGASSSVDVLLGFFHYTVHHYVGHLKAIKQLTVNLESKIATSMENRYLLQMLALGESLIYYVDAIEANGSVLTKLRGSAEKLGWTPKQIAFLDDVILDNLQCARQSQVFSSILSGLMDARGTIVNNNMNVLLRNLTLINVIFLPLNLVAGIGGMSEFSAFTKGIDWRISYGLFALSMILVGWTTWLVLLRVVDKRNREQHRTKR